MFRFAVALTLILAVLAQNCDQQSTFVAKCIELTSPFVVAIAASEWNTDATAFCVLSWAVAWAPLLLSGVL
jgi:hypothetical protein